MCESVHDGRMDSVLTCSPLSPLLDKVLEGRMDDVMTELEAGKSLVNVVPNAWAGSQSTLLNMITQSDIPRGKIQGLIISLLNQGMLSGVFYGLDGSSVTRLKTDVINHSLVLQLSLRGLLEAGGEEELETVESLLCQGIHHYMDKTDIDIVAKHIEKLASEQNSERWRDLRATVLSKSPQSLFNLCRHELVKHLSTVCGSNMKPFDLRTIASVLPIPPLIQQSLSFHHAA